MKTIKPNIIMNVRTLFLGLMLSALHFNAMAQIEPVHNIPSPDVAQLGEYGKIPVSLYTGVPDISIPLYDVQVGNYSLPISVNYHISALKANAPSGSLGLGWSLFAGGYITRSVSGAMDEKNNSKQWLEGIGYYYNVSILRECCADSTLFQRNNAYTVSDTCREMSADEFSFNFCGYSGSFYYAGDGKWQVASDHDIRVEFDADNDGFIWLPDLEKTDVNGNKRLILNDLGTSCYSWLFNKFTLITPDGCRYEFGGPQATEFSISYFHRNMRDLIPTTWRLSKITTPENRTIEFVYDTSSIICDIRYNPQQLSVYGIPTDIAPLPATGRSGMTGYLLFPVNISQIKTPNETIRFDYIKDENFAAGFKIGNTSYLAWGSGGTDPYRRTDLYELLSSNDPADQFHQLLNCKVVNTMSDQMASQTVADKLLNLILKSIVVKSEYDNGLVKSIDFTYSDIYAERRKLTCIREWNRFESTDSDDEAEPDNSDEEEIDENVDERRPNHAPRVHRFNYYTAKKLPVSLLNTQTDHWGYYNGGSVNIFASEDLFTPRATIGMMAKADILTEIIYPTGGKCRFEYEPHRYAKIVNESRTGLYAEPGSDGGLRIASIAILDSKDNVLQQKRYHYTENLGTTTSSGILREKPVTFEVLKFSNGQITIASQGGIFASVTNQNSPIVGYSCVIEEIRDGKQQVQGYVKHRFTNFDTDLYGTNHLEERADLSTLSDSSYIFSYTSRSVERGKLVSKEFFDKEQVLRKQVTYHYSQTDTSYMHTAHQDIITLNSQLHNPVGTLTKTYLYRYLTDSITEISYTGIGAELKRTQIIRYNEHKLPQSVVTRQGADAERKIEYEYSGKDDRFLQRHCISLPVSETTSINGSTRQYSRGYSMGANGVPRLSYERTAINGKNPYLNYRVPHHDAWGNPLEVESNGRHTVYLWGYEGQKLIAQIDNLAYSDLSGYNVSFEGLPNYALIENLRSLFPAAQFHIYRYDTQLRLQTETKPNGETMGYNYDYLGRLIERYRIEKDGNGADRKVLVNLYDYNYLQNF